jgi:hypothetical protein
MFFSNLEDFESNTLFGIAAAVCIIASMAVGYFVFGYIPDTFNQ